MTNAFAHFRNFLLASCIFAVAGCATTAGYENVLSSWVGQSADRLMSSWGAPANTTQLSDGGKVLEYSNQRNVEIGGYTTTVPQTTYHNGTTSVYGSNGGSATGNYNGTSTTYVQQTTPVQNIAMQCVTRFTVNAQGTITNCAWQGNDCRAKEPPQQKQPDEEMKKKMAENGEQIKIIDARGKAICDNPEYAILFLNTSCSGKDITFEQIADSSKITPEQKVVLPKFRTEMDAYSRERLEFIRSVGKNPGKQWADYVDSVQPEVDKYNLDLYNGVISWGEYNQKRKDFYARMQAEYRKIYRDTSP